MNKIRLSAIICSFVSVLGVNAKPVRGTVSDTSGEPIIGATIVVAGTNTGTVTDANGGFTIEASPDSEISVSYIGYTTRRLKIMPGKDSYSVVLQEDTEVLEDVIVVGYGTQRKSDVTGSIASVSADDIADFSSQSLAESLSGLAAGVQVTKGSGAPGEAADIIIRGAGSLNGMAPLYVVDGVAQDAGFDFNMRDVASIEILKDAGSAAIYGSKAAGGVILITTKKGQAERTQIDLNARVGWRDISSPIKLLGTPDWIRARDAWGTGSTLDVLGVTSVDELPNTDWMSVMFGRGIEQEYNVSASGGGEKTKFFLSFGVLDEKGTYMDTRATRYSLRANLDHKVGKHVSFGEEIFASMASYNPATSSSIYNHTIPFRTVPVAEVKDENGDYAQTPMSVGSGPNFAGLEAAYHAYQDRNYNARAQAYLNVEFIPGLVWRTTGSAALSAYSNRRFTEYKDFGPVQVGVDGGALNSNAGTSLNLMFNSILTYEHTWLDAHHLKVMAGTEWWRLDGYNLSATTYGFSVPVASSIALGSAGATKDASDGIPQERRGSAFARINYDYKGRYLLAANFRADASDRFVKKHRWGFFPSVNAGWRLSEENWIKEPAGEWLSNAKIRASWGILGNDNIAQYMYMSSYSLSGVSHAFDNTSIGETGAWVAILGNEDLKWEEVNQVDVGLDLGFFNNRLTLTYDYYNRQTRDMLYRGSLCLTGGMSYYFSSDDPANTIPVYFNAGMVENQGHEITIGWHDRKKDFSYGINLNLSMNANLVKQVGDKPGATTIDRGLDASWPLLTRTEDGYAMSMFYGYRVLGIFQNQEEVDRYNQYALDSWRANNPNHPYGYAPNGQPLTADGKEMGIYYQSQNTGVGDLIYDDNGQGRVSPSSRQYIGNPWPKLTMGLNINLAYKGFDLALVFQGAFGFDVMNLIKPYTHMFMSDNTTAAIFTTSCFGKDNTTITSDPRVGYLNEHNSVIGDGAANRNYSTVSGYLVEKGDYLKLKNLSFGYTLPQKYSRKAKMEKLRIYFSAQNLFTITSYSGIDPEIGGSYLMYNIDHQNRYLPSRLYSFGLDISF